MGRQRRFKTYLKDQLRYSKKTQGGLARAIDVERATVSNWVNGHYTPGVIHIEKIAKYLQRKKKPEEILIVEMVRAIRIEKEKARQEKKCS